MKNVVLILSLFALSPLAISLSTSAAHAQPASSTLSGVKGPIVIDSGVMVVESTPDFAREESFEYLRRADRGITLLNSVNMTDGRYRVRARFDFDANWNSITASGVGLYGAEPVESRMVRAGKAVDIQVRGVGVNINEKAVCDPNCFINMSPTSLPMFVMTRHYDFEKGGPQVFRWTGQDLDRVRTLSGGTAELTFQGERTFDRAVLPGKPRRTVNVRHFTFVESLPLPDGGRFKLDFDLWTDTEHRPLGFRVKTPGSTGSGTVGFRKAWADVRGQLVE